MPRRKLDSLPSAAFQIQLSLAALSAVDLVMSFPAPARSSSTSNQPYPIKPVIERLNGAVSPANNVPATAEYASAAVGALQRQSQAANATAASAGPDAKLDDAERDRVIRAVAVILVAHYLDAQKAQRASDLLLTQEKRGEYDAIGDAPALAERLTQDIQRSIKDSRVAVQFNRTAIPNSPPSPSVAQREEYRAAMLQQNCTIEKVQVLPNGIGYIKFNFFPEPSVCNSTFRASMEKLSQAGAIVIDLRDNTGGFPDMVASVAAELLDQPVLWYNPRATPNASMLSPARGSTLGKKPVYILTSSRTFSGAEHFAYDLKMLKRATVIGETTRGGHPGAAYRIDDHFWMAVPEVRKPSPYGTLDWQGPGVEPDVKVSAADALKVAEKLALERHKK